MSIRLDRIYTRSGDDGTSGLVGGKRARKDDPRIESYGTVDELNSVVGMLRAAIAELPAKSNQWRNAMLEELQRIQQQLFNLGSELASPPDVLKDGMPVVTAANITRLEKQIDAWNEDLERLKSFVLPGGSVIAGWCHIARTVCRRAERRCVSLRGAEPKVRVETVRYLNRLSDYFFVLARWLAKQSGAAEYTWDRNLS